MLHLIEKCDKNVYTWLLYTNLRQMSRENDNNRLKKYRKLKKNCAKRIKKGVIILLVNPEKRSKKYFFKKACFLLKTVI